MDNRPLVWPPEKDGDDVMASFFSESNHGEQPYYLALINGYILYDKQINKSSNQEINLDFASCVGEFQI